MNVYPWTLGSVEAFEMRVVPNAITFTSTYSKTTQTVDFLGERWSAKVDLPALVDDSIGMAREAFFDRLRGPVNLISMWNLKRPVPMGTLRGGSVGAPIPQLSNVATLATTVGASLRAGDMVGIGGQLVRIMQDTVTDGLGNMAIEFLPRARALIPVGSSVVWNKPTANFMLAADGVPTTWRQGMFEGASIDLVEAY